MMVRTQRPPELGYREGMKKLHRSDLFSWADFDEARDVDFNSVLWVRDGGNVVFDPMPQRAHDRAHLTSLGPLAWIVITNSDHIRDAEALAAATGAKIAAPAAERGAEGLTADAWLTDGDVLVEGLTTVALSGSKTPGELAFILEGSTLITGDLVRAHRAGSLMILPDAKLTDRAAAVASVRRLAALPDIEAVLVGDGWPIFRGGGAALAALAAGL